MFRSAEQPSLQDACEPLRRELDEAKAAVIRAQQEVETQERNTERLKATIAEAERAETEAAAADKAAEDSVTAQVQSRGAVGDVPGDPELFEKARTAWARVESLRLVARGIRASLTQKVWDRQREQVVTHEMYMTADELEAREKLERAKDRVEIIIGQIVRDAADPIMQRALELHAELVELIPALCGARHFTRFNLPAYFGSNEQDFITSFERIAQFRVPTFERNMDDLHEVIRPWTDFQERLREDSNAQFKFQ
jgi:hypothetical protein